MAKDENSTTRAWRLYEEGKAYNNSLVPNQYNLVNANVEFFAGNQWSALPNTDAMRSLPKPVFNIIKRIVSSFVASMTSTSTRIQFEPLSYVKVDTPDAELDPNLEIAKMANKEIENLWEKLRIDFRLRDALFDGAITGDYCAHFFFDPRKKPYGNSLGELGEVEGEIEMEMVDGINVMFGNPNDRCVEHQPYILILGREPVSYLKDEYEFYNSDGGEEVQADYDTQYQAGIGGQTELTGDENGKALFVYLYEKKRSKVQRIGLDGEPMYEVVTDKKGNPVIDVDEEGNELYNLLGEPIYKKKEVYDEVETVHVTKCTKSVTIYEDVDTGLTYYPIAWGNWETQKNQYHGRALVTGIIPNQIFINTMFALVMRHLQNLGFPKIIYNKDVLPTYTNAVGEAIGVKGLPPMQGIDGVVTTVRAADMSGQIIQAIDKAMEYTKECLGATDAHLGAVSARNTSAIVALQNASTVPLENPRANLYEWVEDVGRILLDMMATYYGERPIALTTKKTTPSGVVDMIGMPLANDITVSAFKMFDFAKLKHLWLKVKVDVGASTYWSKIAMIQTLDNLKADGTLDILQYLERMPAEYIPMKEELIADIKNKMGLAEQQAMQAATQMTDAENPVLAPTPGNGGGAGGARGKGNLLHSLSQDGASDVNDIPKLSRNALGIK